MYQRSHDKFQIRHRPIYRELSQRLLTPFLFGVAIRYRLGGNHDTLQIFLFLHLAFSIQGRAACWNTPPERLKVKRKCRHWTHGITVILAAVVVDVTTAKVDEPSATATVLSH